MDCSLPGSSIRGIFQASVLEWGAIAFSINTDFLSTYYDPGCGLGFGQRCVGMNEVKVPAL